MSTENPKLSTTDISGFAVTLKPEAIAIRDELLMASGFIETVSSPAELKIAVEVVGKLKGFTSAIEKTREEVKKPVLDAGRLIDATAKAATKETTPEVTRIEKLISDYHREEMRKAEEIRQADMRKQMEIHKATIQTGDSAVTKAIEQKQEQIENLFDPRAASPIEGAKTTSKFVFEVTDIHALLRWNPQYVKMEVDRAQLNARINLANPGCDIFSIPGIIVTEETKVSVKSVKPEALK